jgi:hypothetical protein
LLIRGDSFSMLPAVQLHNQSCFDATKVNDERADRMLPAKFRAIKLSTP